MAKNKEPNYKEILLTALAEPSYSRLEYWQQQQKESGFSELVFYRKLQDALAYFTKVIDSKIAEKESLGIATNDYKLPLLLETDFKIKGELGTTEIQLLNTELKRYFITCFSFEQRVTYYKVAKHNIPFLWLYDTVFTVCEWVKPITKNIEPVKYIEYFFTEIDFDKIEFIPTKDEAKKYFNAIYYGLEQLLKADISKAIHNYQNSISNLTKQQIQETQIQLIELIGNLKRQTRTNEAGISFTQRYNLLYKSIEAKETFSNIDYQNFIAHFNETISNDLLSSFEIINETFKEIAPLIQDKTTNTQPNKEQAIEVEQENDYTLETIEDYLFQFREFMSEPDYNTLSNALYDYFKTGIFPKISKQIQTKGKLNMKRLGWALNELFAANNKGIEKELLLFAKQNISLFKDVPFDENDILNCNLYKYFTTKTK